VCVIISLHTEDRAFYGYGSYRTPIEKPTDSVTVRLPVVVESDESISFHRQQGDILLVLLTYSLRANSHRHFRHDKTVLSVSYPPRPCELDSRRLKTVADKKI